MPVLFGFSHQGHALVTLYVQFIYSDWSKFDKWVHAEKLCSILNLVYFDSWSWQSFVPTCDVSNCRFPLNVQKEIQLLSRVFCYSWLVYLLGFGWEIRRFGKVGNPISDGMVRRLLKSEAILALLDSFQCISNGKAESLLYLMFVNFLI